MCLHTRASSRVCLNSVTNTEIQHSFIFTYKFFFLFASCVSVCKFLTIELQDALEKTGRSKEVLELGEVLDTGKRRRKIKYNTS